MSTKRKQAEPSPVMSRLADYIAAAPRRALPREVAEKTGHHILDTIAAMVSGGGLAAGRTALGYVRRLGGTREATVVGTRINTSAVNAALANAMLAHADETDDSHAPSATHPGCGIVSAALAMAEKHGRDGRALLRAVALGYDVSCRLSFSLGTMAFRATGHSTHTMGPNFGATAAAAALACLRPAQVRHALSYAAQQASGLSCYARDTNHVEKAFVFGGMAARNGVTAATMVASGCTGVDDVFSGERNFFVAFDERDRVGRPPEPEALVRDLGGSWEIMRTNIKRWSVGSPIQAPLDSLHALMKAEGFRAQDVEKVTVRVSQTGANTTDNREMPDICMQHMCAVMLLDGIVTFEAAHDLRRMRDRRVLEVRRRIELIGDAELEALLPERHGIVEVVLRDGRTLRHHTKAVRGTAQNPMTREDVDEKCFHLMAPRLGRKRARALCDAVWNLERCRNVRALRPLLRG